MLIPRVAAVHDLSGFGLFCFSLCMEIVYFLGVEL